MGIENCGPALIWWSREDFLLVIEKTTKWSKRKVGGPWLATELTMIFLGTRKVFRQRLRFWESQHSGGLSPVGNVSLANSIRNRGGQTIRWTYHFVPKIFGTISDPRNDSAKTFPPNWRCLTADRKYILNIYRNWW